MKADKHVLRVVPLNEQVLTDWRHHLRPCFAEWSDWRGIHRERLAAGFAQAQAFQLVLVPGGDALVPVQRQVLPMICS
jgi:hypothetical protein